MLRHYCLLCSHIGEPRWAAVDKGAHVVDMPGASVVAYTGVLARSHQEPHISHNSDKMHHLCRLHYAYGSPPRLMEEEVLQTLMQRSC